MYLLNMVCIQVPILMFNEKIFATIAPATLVSYLTEAMRACRKTEN